MSFTSISSKGQVTIPAKIRRKLGLKPSVKLEVILEEGKIVLIPVIPFRSLRGSIKPEKGDMRKAMEKAVSKHVTEGEK